jgi:TetR/AcrR family transcriptional regulator, transcriptional repressor for nem operon
MALERYLEQSARERIRRLEETLPPKQAARRFIEEVIERSLDDRGRRGCFLINSALEVAPHDKALGALIADRLGEIEAFFRRSIKAARAEGTVPPNRSPEDLARLLLGVLLGIRVLARAKPDRALLEGVARPALALLDFEPTTAEG